MDEASLVLPEAFRALGLDEVCLKGVAAMGFEEPSPVQEAMIPVALSGQDVLGQARTGTGKTAAFTLPIIMQATRGGGTQALILTPTRELAVQVTEEIERLSRFSPLRVVPVYGGTKISSQLRRLGENPEIVVGTPGRVMDMMDRRALQLDGIRWTVLDEVDRMLDIGFRDDIRKILRRAPSNAHRMFVSATLPDDVNRLVEEYSNNLVRLTLSEDKLTVEQVHQSYITVQPWDKYAMLERVLDLDKPQLAIIFTNTKAQTRRVCERLQRHGVKAQQIHGDLVQRQRDKVMARFRDAEVHVLVATDLMGRGIDVPNISHIINYDLPRDIEAYVHRIGRTARMGAAGEAITFVTPEEGKGLTEIEKLINQQIDSREVEGFQASPPPRDIVERMAADQVKEQERAEELSRVRDTVHEDDDLKRKLGPPPKTLGSAFKTPQRRKLKRLKRR